MTWIVIDVNGYIDRKNNYGQTKKESYNPTLDERIITSSEMTAADALDLYKSRDGSEKLFRGDKSYLGGRSMRTYHDEPTHSKIFIEFVALIIRNKIYTCLKDRMKEIHKKKNYMTVPAALKELDKIELIRQADGVYRLDHAVTAVHFLDSPLHAS